MTEIVYAIVRCLTLAWAASTGPVDRYDVYVDGSFTAVAPEPTAIVCFEVDDQIHAVEIVARDAEGASSDPSEPLYVQRIENFDFDGTGEVSIFDVFTCIDEVGTCNNGIYLTPCELPPLPDEDLVF